MPALSTSVFLGFPFRFPLGRPGVILALAAVEHDGVNRAFARCTFLVPVPQGDSLATLNWHLIEQCLRDPVERTCGKPATRQELLSDDRVAFPCATSTLGQTIGIAQQHPNITISALGTGGVDCEFTLLTLATTPYISTAIYG
jgi:hypothetical protein